jgi:hypothetical protein
MIFQYKEHVFCAVLFDVDIDPFLTFGGGV